MDYKIGKVLISEQEIKERVAALGEQISKDYAGQKVVMICILRGASIFMSDLVRAISSDVDVVLEFMRVSSYGGGTQSTGEVKIIQDLDNPVKGEHLLIVEDIIDTGLTLDKLKDYLNAREPKSLKLCAMLDKAPRRLVPVTIDYCGFTIPDEFVIGYGLDYAEHWRHLPAIYVAEPLKEEQV